MLFRFAVRLNDGSESLNHDPEYSAGRIVFTRPRWPPSEQSLRNRSSSCGGMQRRARGQPMMVTPGTLMGHYEACGWPNQSVRLSLSMRSSRGDSPRF